MKLSIVIPAYNEEDTLPEVLTSICNRFNLEIKETEIIVINDKSTDGTEKILKEFKSWPVNFKYFTNKKNMGHAYSMLRGLKAANGEYVLYMDADNQIKVEDMYFNSDYDLISGYREHRQDKFFRKVISFILKLTIFVRHGLWIRDANCPFKLFKRERLEFLMALLKDNSVVPSISMEILARKYKMTTMKIPVDHYPYIKERKGTLQSLNKKSIKIFWEAFKEVWNP